MFTRKMVFNENLTAFTRLKRWVFKYSRFHGIQIPKYMNVPEHGESFLHTENSGSSTGVSL